MGIEGAMGANPLEVAAMGAPGVVPAGPIVTTGSPLTTGLAISRTMLAVSGVRGWLTS